MEDNVLYEWLSKYIENNDKLVQYLYILYLLFSKYQNSIYSYIDQVKSVDKKLWDMLEFFRDEKYTKKDVYKILQYAIKKTWYNIYNLSKSISFNDIPLRWDVIKNQVKDDIWLYIKSADNKIYKRFLLDDVKKSLWI